MINKIIFAQGAIFLLILAGSRSARLPDQDTSREANLPNPASEFCIEQGYKLEIVTAGDGSQGGICLFDDGSSCDEWAYFRGECGPSALKNAPGATG